MPQPINKIVCLVMLFAVLRCVAQIHANPLLDNHRWQEYSYGLSILPPLGASVHKRTGDDAVVRLNSKDGYAINLFIKESSVEISLPTVRRQALEQMAGVYPSATVLMDKQQKQGNYQQLSLHFYIPKTKQGAWVTAQVFIQLGPQVFALFQLETPKSAYDLAKPTFNAVIQSLQVTDPRKLLADREKLLDAGHELLSQLKFDQLRNRLIPQQWFRFVEGDRDIGYMRIRQVYGKLDDRKIVINKREIPMPAYLAGEGCKVQAMVRMQIADTLYDSLNVCYVSAQRDEEVWSIRTTERPQGQRKVAKYKRNRNNALKLDVEQIPVDLQNSWIETGLASNKKIQLSRRNPSNYKEYEWAIPPKAYLSQVDLHLLPLLLKDQSDGTWGFYAYHPNSGKISFRTERMEHKSNGNFVMYTRLTPEDVNEQITEYDPQGKIVQRILAGGRKLISATQRQIEILWPNFVK